MPLQYAKVEETPDTYTFTTVPCPQCDSQKEITVNAPDLFRYHQGEFVQKAFPYLSAGDREQLFMTGICDPCFMAMFAEEDDDGD